MLTGILCHVSNHVVIDDLGWPLNVISSILILLIYCICHVLSNYLYVATLVLTRRQISYGELS